MLPYTPPTTGYPNYANALTRTKDCMVSDLMPHVTDFDAIVCAGDFHGVTLAAIAAAFMGKPLVIVCTHDHTDVVSHIEVIGEFDPRMRLLYVDDFFALGASLRRTLDYLNQSKPANVVATYEAQIRDYQAVEATPAGPRTVTGLDGVQRAIGA